MKYQVLNLCITRKEFNSRFFQNVNAYTYKNYLAFHSEDVFYGKLSGSHFTLLFKPAFIRNSFTTIIRGKIVEQNGKCMIHYTYSMLRAVQLFLIAWIACFLFLGILMFFCSTYFVFIPMIFAAMGIAILTIKSKKRKALLLNKLKIITKH